MSELQLKGPWRRRGRTSGPRVFSSPTALFLEPVYSGYRLVTVRPTTPGLHSNNVKYLNVQIYWFSSQDQLGPSLACWTYPPGWLWLQLHWTLDLQPPRKNLAAIAAQRPVNNARQKSVSSVKSASRNSHSKINISSKNVVAHFAWRWEFANTFKW